MKKKDIMKQVMLSLTAVVFIFGGGFGVWWQILKIDFKALDFGEFNVKLFLVFALMIVVGGKLIKYGQNNIQAEISDMTGAEFENHIANLLRRKGHSVKMTPKNGDYGVDIVMDGCTAIQCKRYGKNVGVKAVQEVYAGMQHYGCTNAIVVTNSYFTPNAVTLAGELGVSLWDKDTIWRMM